MLLRALARLQEINTMLTRERLRYGCAEMGPTNARMQRGRRVV